MVSPVPLLGSPLWTEDLPQNPFPELLLTEMASD